jgi:flagellar biosynthetic protein FlhB
MPEQSYQERTEPATPRRKREAREKGNVARSMEVNSAIVLLAAVIALRFFGGTLMNHLMNIARWILSRVSVIELTTEALPGMVMSGIQFMGLMLGPIILMIMVAGVSASVVQGGFVFAGEPIKPKFSKISPAKGFKRMFSIRSVVEMIKGLIKLLIIGVIGYSTLRGELNSVPYLMDQDVPQIMAFLGNMGFKLMLRASLALLIMAVLDYAYQKFEFEKKLRMTKQEVKEEYKRTEGDPLIKSRIRSIQRERARQRMLSDVPKADVVVTNPVHLAVAIKYDSHKMAAPTVVAKGARLVAEKIKEIAQAHDVPIVENKTLARLLYRTVEIGAQIPFELYKAVAEILAYVYRLKKKSSY